VLAALAVPFLDQRLRIVIAALRRVEQTLGRVAVHHHLAGDVEHVALMRFGEEGLGRLLVHRAIGGNGRRAVADHLVEEQARDAAAMLRVDEARFLGESVGVQPFQQLGAIGRDDLHLREMHMRVDEARQDQRCGRWSMTSTSPAWAAILGIGPTATILPSRTSTAPSSS
jgi:hypothetical protein